LVDREVFGRRLGKLEELLRDLRHLAILPREQFLREHAVLEAYAAAVAKAAASG